MSLQELVHHIERLLWLMVILNFVDGVQAVMSGVIQGLGRQKFGLLVNIVAFYVIAIPLACIFGFLLHLEVEGLYCGLLLGSTAQALAFMFFSSRVDWDQEAQTAAARVQELETNSRNKLAPGDGDTV